MSRNRHLSPERKAAIKLAARQRVKDVWTCLDILCPDLTLKAKKVIARTALKLPREEDQKPPRIMITPAQVASIVWPNSQCANRYCSMVLFTNEIAEELNEFFKQEQ
jgi:hypothetical protein